MPPTVWIDLPDEGDFATTLFPSQKKVENISLQKGFPKLAYTPSSISVVLDLATEG